LRGEHKSKDLGYVVNKKGNFDTGVACAKNGVRPALKIDTSKTNLKKGRQFTLDNCIFEMITDNLALIDRCVCTAKLTNGGSLSYNGYSHCEAKKKSGFLA